MNTEHPDLTASKAQIKSKARVSAHGEVFTNEREVNAMLDLVKHETERIDSRFLEPACGDGNFLAEILRRKLAVCHDLVKQKKAPNWSMRKILYLLSVAFMALRFCLIMRRLVENDFS